MCYCAGALPKMEIFPDKCYDRKILLCTQSTSVKSIVVHTKIYLIQIQYFQHMRTYVVWAPQILVFIARSTHFRDRIIKLNEFGH